MAGQVRWVAGEAGCRGGLEAGNVQAALRRSHTSAPALQGRLTAEVMSRLVMGLSHSPGWRSAGMMGAVLVVAQAAVGGGAVGGAQGGGAAGTAIA